MNQIVRLEDARAQRLAPAVSFEHQLHLAESFARSRLFGIENADQALALMALCEAEGLHPAIAVRDYHIIKGKPALKSDAMLARFQAAGGKVRWICMSDTKVEGEFSHPAGGSVTIDWDKQRAETAGFWGKDNWKKFPRAMLRARTISEGIRSVFPGVVAGVYTPEEMQDEPAIAEHHEPQIRQAQAEQQKPVYPDTQFATNLPGWTTLIESGKKPAVNVLATIRAKYTLTDEQVRTINNIKVLPQEGAQSEGEGE